MDTLRLGAWRVGFAIEVRDKMDATPNNNGIYSLQAKVDSQVVHSFSMDKIPFSKSKFINAHIDYAHKTATFKAIEFVLEYQDGNYPQFIKFQLTQDRCDIIDSYKAGDQVKVHFSLRGREWNEKYFTNLNAWRIEPMANSEPAPANDFPDFEEAGNSPSGESAQEMKLEDFDDLPF